MTWDGLGADGQAILAGTAQVTAEFPFVAGESPSVEAYQAAGGPDPIGVALQVDTVGPTSETLNPDEAIDAALGDRVFRQWLDSRPPANWVDARLRWESGQWRVSLTALIGNIQETANVDIDAASGAVTAIEFTSDEQDLLELDS